MFNTPGDSITLGPGAQGLSLPARKMLLAQYADKAQSGHLYTDPAWAAWGASMRQRRMIDHPSMGNPAIGPSPTIDDLMFGNSAGQNAGYKVWANNVADPVTPRGDSGWRSSPMQLAAYEAPGAPQSSATNPLTQSSSAMRQLKPLPYPKTNSTLNPAAIEKAKNTVGTNTGKRPLTPKEKAYFANFRRNAASDEGPSEPWYSPYNTNFGVVGGHDLLGKGTINFVSGAGDTLSYGLTKYGRKYLGQYLGAGDANSVVQYDSPSYHWGEAAGTAIDMGLGGGAGLKVAGEVGAKELAERAAWSELKSLAKKLKLPAPIREDLKEFSHFIPKRTINWLEKHTSNPTIKKLLRQFEHSDANGRYVSPKRHFMHDPFRKLAGTGKRVKPGVTPVTIKRLPVGVQQADRTPTVYRGAAGGAAVSIGHHYGGREHKK